MTLPKNIFVFFEFIGLPKASPKPPKPPQSLAKASQSLPEAPPASPKPSPKTFNPYEATRFPRRHGFTKIKRNVCLDIQNERGTYTGAPLFSKRETLANSLLEIGSLSTRLIKFKIFRKIRKLQNLKHSQKSLQKCRLFHTLENRRRY